MNFNELKEVFEEISPSDYLSTLVNDRPYNGQPHTDTGERGKTEIKGITFRDLRDCFIRGAFHASGLSPEDYPKSLYELNWNEMDVLAVYQNMSCEVEKKMGIYPNVEKLVREE